MMTEASAAVPKPPGIALRRQIALAEKAVGLGTRREQDMLVQHQDSGGLFFGFPLLVDHIVKVDGKSVEEAEAIVGRVITRDNRLNIGLIQYGIEPYEYPPNRIDDMLKHALAPVYNLVDRSLDVGYPQGFNRHGSEHVNTVTKRVIDLLMKKGVSGEVVQRGIIAARGHDLGNLLSRDAHPVISVVLLRKIIPLLVDSYRDYDSDRELTEKELKEEFLKFDRANWKIIKKAILLHEPKAAYAYIHSWGDLSTEERHKKMAEFFGPEALALIIADKTDIGPGRSSEYKRRVNDPHEEINVLGRTEAVELRDKNTTFRWSLTFTPELSPEDIQFYPHLAQRRRLDRRHVLHEPPMHTWTHLLWTTYFERITLAVDAAFALYPSVDTLEIVMNDQSSGSSIVQKFSRDNLDQEVARLKNFYFNGNNEHKP